MMFLFARLAVDKRTQGHGLGASLLQDAFSRFLMTQETIGARALLAHAKDEAARSFYLKWGFSATEEFPFNLYILTKTSRATLADL